MREAQGHGAPSTARKGSTDCDLLLTRWFFGVNNSSSKKNFTSGDEGEVSGRGAVEKGEPTSSVPTSALCVQDEPSNMAGSSSRAKDGELLHSTMRRV